MQVEAAARGDVQPVPPNQADEPEEHLYWNRLAIPETLQEKARLWKDMLQEHTKAGMNVLEVGSSLAAVVALLTDDQNAALTLIQLTQSAINTLASTAPAPGRSMPILSADVIEALDLWTTSCKHVLRVAAGGTDVAKMKSLTKEAVLKAAAVSC
jgi:hypothetical protein